MSALTLFMKTSQVIALAISAILLIINAFVVFFYVTPTPTPSDPLQFNTTYRVIVGVGTFLILVGLLWAYMDDRKSSTFAGRTL